MERRAPRADVPKHEPQHRQPSEVDVIAVGPERDVVTEERSHLRGVGHASHPCQRDDVVQRTAILGLEADVLTQLRSDPPRPQHVIHRLTQPEIGRQRERCDQIGQPHS